MNPQEELAYMNLQAKLSQQEINQSKLSQAVTIFSQNNEPENLVKWQLDIDSSLLRIERLLRKQKPMRDKQNNVIFINNPENELLNEYGINEIMNLLSSYVNKEIMLSCYDDQQIDKIMEQFGDELIDFLNNNLEKFGLDTPDKQKHYPMLWMTIVNLVDATYRKSLNGLTLENLKTARVVTQTEPLGKNIMYPQMNKPRFNPLKPSTWKT